MTKDGYIQDSNGNSLLPITHSRNVIVDDEGTRLNAALDDLKSNFQAGVDGIYDAIVAQGTTPASKSQSDIKTGIGTLATNKYNAGVSSVKAFEPLFSGISNTGYDRGANRDFWLETAGYYIVSVSNGGASATNFGNNTASVLSGNGSRLGEWAASAHSQTDSEYRAWAGSYLALFLVNEGGAAIRCWSQQGNHSTGQTIMIVRIQ